MPLKSIPVCAIVNAMRRALKFAAISLLFAAVLYSADASAFPQIMVEGEDADCSKCHVLDIEEATRIIRPLNPAIEVTAVGPGPVEGMWEVVIEARGKKGIAYIDFSKEHIFTGSILKASTRENLTSLKLYDLSKVAFSSIPLDEALVMGRPDAKYKVIVFDDPD